MSNSRDKTILNLIFNPLLPDGNYIADELPEELEDPQEDVNEDFLESRNLEKEGIREAEQGEIDKAIGIFTRAINLAPNNASAFNNRAQAYQLKGKTEEAIKDIDTALKLSGGHGRSGCQAFCQRGVLHRKNGEDDLARNDFTAAAKLGSQFAKHQLVELNPYAKLCNQMLHQVMTKLTSGEQ